MPRRLLTIGVVLAALAATSARAQDGSALEQAESAYLEVDFEGTRDHALEALRGGRLDPAQLVRAYQLLGIASSALGDEDAARDYFVRMLGIDLDATLDESVPPRLRNPYLEARGIWAARQGRLGIEVGLDRERSAVQVTLRDPTDMARRVRVAARVEGAAEYATQEYPAGASVSAAVAGAAEADRVEYYVEVLDMHGNVIVSEGGPFAPRVVGRTAVEGGGGGGLGIFGEPVLWIVVGAVVLVALGIGIGVGVDQSSQLGLETGVSIGVE